MYILQIESFLSIVTNKIIEVDYYMTISSYIIYESNEDFYISENDLEIMKH